MTENDNILELEQMRSQFNSLKSLLKEQTIVNEKMMRNAMKGKYNKVRLDLKFSIFFELIALPLMAVILWQLALPLWFVIVTEAFILSALIASMFSLRRYASDDLMTGNLTSVAMRLIKYKRFGIYWFIYAIPFLIFWLLFFFDFITEGRESEFTNGVVFGGIVGGVFGATLGTISYVQNLKRMNSILREIKEMKK